MKVILKNASIVTMNERMEIVRNGSILIENGVIKEIGSKVISDLEDAEILDLEGKLVMPGFINTHTHLPMTLLRGYADDLPLHRWLNEFIFPAEAQLMTPGNIAIGCRMALIELIKSGTTCFNDMYFLEDIIAEESVKAGVRGVIGESLTDFPTPSFKNLDEGLVITKHLLERWSDHPLISPVVCLHSPYTCSKETLLKGKELAERYNSRIHTHVSETRKEVGDVIASTGYSPGEYLDSIGLLDSNLIAAHCVWLNDNEISLFAEKGVAIVHNPKSNLKLGSGIANIDRYLQAGIVVAIGTDGSASNNTLNMIEEMRFAALLQKGIHQRPEAINAATALQMATINGAKALGIDHITGSLEVGKRADLIVADQFSQNMLPVYNEYAAVVYSMESRNILHSMVNGEWIMREGKVLRIDEEETIDLFRHRQLSLI